MKILILKDDYDEIYHLKHKKHIFLLYNKITIKVFVEIISFLCDSNMTVYDNDFTVQQFWVPK